MSRHTGQRHSGSSRASTMFSPMRISRHQPHHAPRPRPPGGCRRRSLETPARKNNQTRTRPSSLSSHNASDIRRGEPEA
eukprot:395-Pelagococcus_subviridis.AAC.2